MSLASSVTGFVILDRSQNHQPWINAQRLSSYVEFWSPWQVFIMDEIHVDVVPVLLCEGVRLFDRLGSKHISLEQTEVGEGDQVAHLTYRVIN